MPETEHLLSSPANAERLKAAIRDLERPSLIARIRSGWSFLLTKLNAFASTLFFYLSINSQLPPPAEAMIDKIPGAWQMMVRLALPFFWWLLIEYAKAKAVKKAKAQGAAQT